VILQIILGTVIVVAVVSRFSKDLAGRISDFAFLVFFAVYAGAALFWLIVGATPALAHAFPSVETGLLNVGEGQAGVPAWCEVMADRAAVASRGVVLEDYGLAGRQPGGLVILEYLFSAVNIALGVFLVWLRPRDWAARLLAVGMVGTGAVFNLQSHTSLQIMPAVLIASTHDNFHLIAGVSYVLALLLFPDGRPAFHFPQLRGAQRIPLYVPGLILVMAAFLIGNWFHGTPDGFVALFGVLIPIAGIASQTARLRHAATPEGRQQSRIVLSLLIVVFLVAVMVAIPLLVVSEGGANVSLETEQQVKRVLFRVFPPLFATIPIGLFLVMVRYRLWDIDRVVNRALVYTALTAILGAAYFAGVVLLGLVFRPLTGGSDLAIVGTTLAVAALFRPARSRIQSAVDRAFYRRKYDAARTLEAFAARVRDEVDLDAISLDLLAVVEETMQPAHASLWLAPPAVAPLPADHGRPRGHFVTISGRDAGTGIGR
jgi:hypothetical protein